MMLFLADWVDKKWFSKFLILWGLMQLGFGAAVYYFENIVPAAVFLGVGLITLLASFMGKKYSQKHIYLFYGEIIVLNIAAVIILGLGTGFYLQLLGIYFCLPLLLAGDKKGHIYLQVIGILTGSLLMILDWYLLPLYSLPDFYEQVFFAVNLFTTLLWVMWLTFRYDETHYEVEIEETIEIFADEEETTESKTPEEKPAYFDWFAEDEPEEEEDKPEISNAKLAENQKDKSKNSRKNKKENKKESKNDKDNNDNKEEVVSKKKGKIQFVPKLKWSNTPKQEIVVQEKVKPEVSATSGREEFTVRAAEQTEESKDVVKNTVQLTQPVDEIEKIEKNEADKQEKIATQDAKTKQDSKVTEEVEVKEEPIVLDALTGAMSKDSMLKMVDDIVAQRRQDVIVALVDVDNFNGINAVYGKEVGDVVLEKLARLMKWRLPDFYVSRWNGDQFVLMNSTLTRHEAEAEIVRFHELLKKEIFLHQQFSIKITVTIGFTWSKEPDEIEKLVDEADRLMIWGKKQGRNQVVIKSIQLEYTTAMMNRNRPDAETGKYPEKEKKE